MKSKYTIPIVIIFSGTLLAVAVYISTPKPMRTSAGNPALVRPVSTSDHIFGNPSAKVMIVEYADFDCQYCKGFNETLNQIITNEGTKGLVAWVYREFPLAKAPSNAMGSAEAAECIARVAGNNSFWKFEYLLFAKQPVKPKDYGTLAKSIGISSSVFATCFANASNLVDARINADRKNALEMGALGAPYSLILVSGKPPIVMNGAYPYDAVKRLVKKALSN